jgi:hypothetical protein
MINRECRREQLVDQPGPSEDLAECHGYRLLADQASAMLNGIGPRSCGKKIGG